MRNMQDHYPQRGDQVEAWIKERRDERVPNGPETPAWYALDNLLDEYREAADTGQSLENMVNGEQPVSEIPKMKKEKKS